MLKERQPEAKQVTIIKIAYGTVGQRRCTRGLESEQI